MRIDPHKFFDFLLLLMLCACLAFIYLNFVQNSVAHRPNPCYNVCGSVGGIGWRCVYGALHGAGIKGHLF